LDQLERVNSLIVHWGDAAFREAGRGGLDSRLHIIRRQLEVALGILSSVGGPALPECEKVALTQGPMFPSAAEAANLLAACQKEVVASLADPSLQPATTEAPSSGSD